MINSTSSTTPQRYSPDNFSLGELATTNLIARGDSVVDWKRTYFQNREGVDQFLRLNLFDPDSEHDVARMEAILAQAVRYLRKTFSYRVAREVARPKEIQDIFLLASGVAEPKKLRRIACVVLKVMHTVHHIEARELLFKAHISEVELSEKVDARVREVLTRLSAEVPIVRFEGNVKSRDSVITKLISKRDNLAAQVYDRHRYRIVVKDRPALFSTVIGLANELFPFNYVLPGQTQNTLLDIGELLHVAPGLRATARKIDLDTEPNREFNEFSGRSYRILNFIVSLPLRLDPGLVFARPDDPDLGHVVFAPVELQVLDEATLAHNESGENAHGRYKRRQLKRVLSRLSRGLVVPRSKKSKVPGRASPVSDDR